MASSVDDVKTALADASVIAAAPKVLASTLFVGRYLYALITRADKYTPEDQIRHQRLCRQYTALVSPVLPPQWALDDDKRPQYTFNLEYSADRFSEELDRLRGIAPASIHQSARCMLSTIIKLMDSLSKRKKGKLRKGSVESMFFIELAAWLVEKLPLEDFKTEKTLVMLQNMKKYCEYVSENVLVPENGEKAAARNNPIAALSEIIENLKGMIERTKHLIQSTTFIEHAERLDNAVLNMAAQTFHIMHLLIRGKHEHETELSVSLFLDKGQTHRPKLHRYRAQRLAYWLEETLNVLGITRNDFHNQTVPKLASVHSHLRHEWVGDTTGSLPKHLCNLKHTEWGHWDFLIEDKTESEISSMLQDIRNIHQNTLKLYHLRRFLWNIRRVAPMYGEVWLYGDTTGRAMVSTLMSVAKDIVTENNTHLSTFWETCHRAYESKRKAGAIRQTDASYIAMNAAIDQYRRFTFHFENAEAGIQSIKEQCRTFKSRLEKAEESKHQLLHGLIEYMEYHKRTDGDNYRILKQALEAHENTLKPVRVVGATEDTAVEETSINEVPRRKVIKIDEETSLTSDGIIERVMKARTTRTATKKRALSSDVEAAAAPQWDSLEAMPKKESRIAQIARSVSPFRTHFSRFLHPFMSKPIETSPDTRTIKIAPHDSTKILRRSASVGPKKGIELRSSIAQPRLNAIPENIKKSMSFSDNTKPHALDSSSTHTTSLTQHKDTMMATPANVIQQYLYEKNQLSVAYEIQQIFKSDETPAAEDLKLSPCRAFCNDFHRRIYREIVAPYFTGLSMAAVGAFFHGDRGVLKEFQAKFNRAIRVIRDDLLPLKTRHEPTYELQLQLIDTCLYANLNAMCMDMKWYSKASELYHESSSPELSAVLEPLRECEDGMLELVSLAGRLVKETARADHMTAIVQELRNEMKEMKADLKRLKQPMTEKDKYHQHIPRLHSESELDSNDNTPEEGYRSHGSDASNKFDRYRFHHNQGSGDSGGEDWHGVASQYSSASKRK